MNNQISSWRLFHHHLVGYQLKEADTSPPSLLTSSPPPPPPPLKAHVLLPVLLSGFSSISQRRKMIKATRNFYEKMKTYRLKDLKILHLMVCKIVSKLYLLSNSGCDLRIITRNRIQNQTQL